MSDLTNVKMTDNDKLCEVLRQFYSAETKSVACEPLDMAVTTRLLLQQFSTGSGRVNLSIGNLAIQLNTSESTIQRSLRRLKKLGWLRVSSGKRTCRSNEYEVVVDNLPLDADLKRVIVTDSARRIAGFYIAAIETRRPRKHRHGPKTLERFAFTVQSLIDKRCGGNVNALIGLINFSLDDPRFSGVALRGPHALRTSWKSITAAHDAAVATWCAQ